MAWHQRTSKSLNGDRGWQLALVLDVRETQHESDHDKGQQNQHQDPVPPPLPATQLLGRFFGTGWRSRSCGSLLGYGAII